MSWDDNTTQWPRWKPWDYFGYYNLGIVQIPPPLPVVGMTNRTTGAVWYLGFDPTNGNRIVLTDTPPNAAPIRVFAPFDGPFIGSYGLRMGVDQATFRGVTGAHLVFDAYPGLNDGNCPIAFPVAGSSLNYAVIEAVRQSNPNTFDHLAYEALLRSPAAPTGPNSSLPGENV